MKAEQVLLDVSMVALGGAGGALARFGVALWIHHDHPRVFPLGTLVVNVVGCLLIGVLMHLFAKGHLPVNARLLLVTGFLGSLTTFSTFGHETIELVREGEAVRAGVNVLANLLLGLAGVVVGWQAVRLLFAG